MNSPLPETPRRGRPKRSHHADLRHALLETSRVLLDQVGPADLSIREVARRAGCTHQAPYHYFKDREALISALVCEGFEQLASAMRAVNDSADLHPVETTLIQSGNAYVTFAIRNPGLFRIMFRPDFCNPERHLEVSDAGRCTYLELQRLNQLVFKQRATEATATLLWAHIHGLSCLMVDGPFSTLNPAEQEMLFDQVSQAFVARMLSETR